MTSTAHSEIDEVREATDLVRLISEHITLQPRGREYVGVCPFHDDHKPSLAVVTHKGSAFFHCFACGASGDCFRFMMRYHNMEFGEALRFLAERAGITLRSRHNEPVDGGAPNRRALIEASRFASDFFRQTLADPVTGAAAATAIEQRAIAAPLVETFMIGAAPAAFDGLLRRLGGKASAIRTAEAAGLLKPRNGGGHYDTFRNRLIFPICDEVGRPVAFGGRVLDPEDAPKYLNSAESPIFRKSRTLYGLHIAKRAIIDTGQAIVTEGYTDVIACHGAGFTNVVGTLGTALTREHAMVLGRLVDTVVLVFDGDEAGRKAADRALEVFFSAPVDVRICVLPGGMDPDDLLRDADGADRFRSALAGARDALEYKLERFRQVLDEASGLSGRQRVLEAFLRELGELGFGALSGVRKRLVLAQLADLFSLSIGDIERALPRGRTPSRGPADPGTTTTAATLLEEPDGQPVSRARQLAERELLSIVLFEPSCGCGPLPTSDESVGQATELTGRFSPADFRDRASRAIAELIFPWLANGEIFGMERILGQLADEETAAIAAQLFREGRRLCENDEHAAEAAVAGMVETLDQLIAREQYESGVSRFRPDAEEDGSGAVLEQIRRRSEHGDLPGAIAQLRG